MGYGIYGCETIYMRRIMVAGGGMGNGNAYANVEIHYADEEMEDIDSVWYKEYGKNPVSKYIGNDVEWEHEEGEAYQGFTFKVLNNGKYVDSSDEEEEDIDSQDEEAHGSWSDDSKPH